MNLVVDVGNTRTKVAVFSQEKEMYSSVLKVGLKEGIEKLRESFPLINKAILSNVKPFEPCARLLFQGLEFIEFDTRISLPLHILYNPIEKLGKDRLAAAMGAFSIFPEQNLLVIDAGTCTTIDLLDNKKQFHGGAILLGMQKKAEMLHKFTANLPLLDMHNRELPLLIGMNTEESMFSGILNGSLFEVQGFIERYTKLYPDLQVLISGGDGAFFHSNLGRTTYLYQNIVLIGLNKILNIHAK